MKVKRTEEIKRYVIEHGSATLKELEETFAVSLNTIRRDITDILEDPKFEKVYGGISIKENQLVTFESRDVTRKESKKNIAKISSEMIHEGDIIFIDSGTTTRYILDFVPKDLSFTLLTNSLDVLIQGALFPKVTLIVVGDTFKHSTRSFIGLHQLASINNYNINKAFMAATAVSLTNGLMNSDHLEYEIKKKVTERATEKILLVDSSKFDKSTLITYAPLSAITTLITDKQPPENYVSWAAQHQMTLLTAQ